MREHSSAQMAEAFIDSRLGDNHGYMFGTLPANVDVGRIFDL